MILKLIKIGWRFLADLGGVLSSLGLLVFGLFWAYAHARNFAIQHRFGALVILILFVLSVIFILRSVRDIFKKIKQSFRTEIVSTKLDALEQRVRSPTHLDMSEVLPSTKLLEQIYNLILEDAERWASDAKLDSHNLYVEVSTSGIRIRTQTFFISEWKKEQMVIYYPSLSTDLEKLKYRDEDGVPIFKVPNWREATIAAFNKISSHLPATFKVVVNSSDSPDDLGIWFQYQNGAVKDEVHFELHGNDLTCRDDGSVKKVQF